MARGCDLEPPASPPGALLAAPAPETPREEEHEEQVGNADAHHGLGVVPGQVHR